MNRLILLCGLALCLFSGLAAVGDYSLTYLDLEPSSISLALGGSPAGAANIWQNSVFGAYGNPALLSFNPGLTYSNGGYQAYSSLQNKVNYKGSLVSLSQLGLGFMYSAPNGIEGNWGLGLDYGPMELTDETGTSLGSYETYDNARVWGLSMNLFEFCRGLIPDHHPIFDHIDVAFGANQILNGSDYGPLNPGGKAEEDVLEANVSVVGGIVRLNHTVADLVSLEAVYGVSHFNPGRNTFVVNDQENQIRDRVSQSAAFAASVKSDKVLAGGLDPVYIFCENLATVRVLRGSTDTYSPDPDIQGNGVEVGFLDTFFFRRGEYKDPANGINGITSGYGIDLHYRDLVSLSYNYAEFPDINGPLMGPKALKTHDLNFNICLSKLIAKL